MRRLPPRARPKPSFRADIEGLRAIAILMVVACHATMPHANGGFVGVDVFFVISGYLISRLLVTEWSSTGRIDLLGFYARRARRLVPALVLMLVATAAAACVLLAPFEQVDQAPSVTAAALWFSNIRFALTDLDYFGPASSSNLTLHTWSLGVEEQFYLVWPAWLLGLLGALRWQRPHADAGQLLRGLWATLALAVALAFVLTRASPRLGFYMMPARFWQFAAGALVFAAIEQRRASVLPAFTGTACGVAGLAILALVTATFDASTPYPSLWSALPTASAALLIAAGSLSPANPATRLLSVAPLQWLGRVSYGWYLWHWPVLVLGLTLTSAPTGPIRFALACGSLVMAFASHRFVEVPLRRPASTHPANAAVLVVAALALLTIATASQAWQRIIPAWNGLPRQQWVRAAHSDIPALYGAGCDDWYSSDRVVACVFGSGAAAHTALVFGDSVALQWFPAFERVFHRDKWRLVVLTKSSCPAADVDFVYDRIGRRYDECTRWRRAALSYVATELKPDLVVMGSSGAYAFDRRQWREGTRSVLERLTTVTPLVYVLRPTPILTFDAPACLARATWRPTWLQNSRECSVPVRPSEVFDGIADAVAADPRVRVVDLNESVCPAGVCRAVQNGQITYRDPQHLSASYAGSLAPALSAKLMPGIRYVESQARAANAR